jgi:hypothetical protein
MVRSIAVAAGARLLEQLLKSVGVGRRTEKLRCPCGAEMESRGVREKRIVTLLGPVQFRRSAYACPRCGATRYPGDEELGIAGTSRSPGVQRQVARLGAKETFREVALDLRELAGIRLSRKDAERLAEGIGAQMQQWTAAQRTECRFREPPPSAAPKTGETLYIEFDGTGVPMVPRDVEGRKGKQPDGTARTREAKLGCVFTQTTFDEQGRPIRDPATTSFTGAIEASGEFAERIFGEAVRRGLYEARRVVVLTDGAKWIENIVHHHFPGATHIIDLYHAREHLVELCRLLFDRDIKKLNRWKDRWWDDLDDGNIEKIVREARDALPREGPRAKDARTAIAYFEKNKERMRYALFRNEGMFVGSGVVEAGCKHIIGQRLKQSGMEWTIRGANAIIELRCVEASNRTEDYWEQRSA